MRNKEIRFGTKARKGMVEGVNITANVVKATLGSKGRNVAIETMNGSPIITKDGTSASKAVKLSDPYQNLGANLMIDVGIAQNDESGDGTSSATVIAQAIVNRGMKSISPRLNPIAIKRGIDKATELVVVELKKEAKEITSSEEIAQVASISANNDTELGNTIAGAIETVGKDGIITVDESKSFDTFVEYVEGMSIKRGYISPYFATDRDTMTTTFNNPYILILDNSVSSMGEILPLLEKVKQTNRPLLMITEDLEGNVLNTLAVNVMKGVLQVCAIKSPAFKDARKNILEDIAILTGGEVISSALGKAIEITQLTDLGEATKVVISKNDTLIIGGKGEDKAILDRVAQLRTQIEECTDDYAEEKLQERLAKLSGGVAILNVGATTEVELKEKKDRVEDALSATRSAIDEGIVAGGGTILAKIAHRLKSKDTSSMTKEEKVGLKIIIKALQEPCKQIANNAGANGSKVVKNVMKTPMNIGFNANTLTYVDMLKEGIVDSVRTTRTALQSASSIASLLLTTEVGIVNEERDVTPRVPMPRMG